MQLLGVRRAEPVDNGFRTLGPIVSTTNVSPSYQPINSPRQDGFTLGVWGDVGIDVPDDRARLVDKHDLVARLHDQERSAGLIMKDGVPGGTQDELAVNWILPLSISSMSFFR